MTKLFPSRKKNVKILNEELEFDSCTIKQNKKKKICKFQSLFDFFFFVRYCFLVRSISL